MDRRYQLKMFSARGVEVHLHASLIFLIFYVFVIASTQFPEVVRLSGVDASSVMQSPHLWGLLFTFSLIASILVHEFSHVLVAQFLGGEVRRITLMMLGGVSEIESMPESPRVELQVAAIGPMVSLFIGIALYNIHQFTTSPNLMLYGYWIGQLNIVLGIFNLIPAFPTDGGRILRSILVSKQGSLRGTKNAVTLSAVFSVFFAVIGILQFNFILLLIALFIYASAKTELFSLTAREALKDLRVRDLMVLVPGITENASLSEAATMMLQTRNMLLPVITNDKALIINAHDLNRIPKRLWNETHVNAVDTPALNVVDIDASLETALKQGFSSGLRTIPVMDQQKIVGLIRFSDLIEMIRLRQLT